MVTAQKPESQDICFVAGSVGDFLAQHGGKTPGGWIVHKSGLRLGRHEGVHQFTVGQRKGLALGGNEEPLYVLEIDRENHSVVVGTKADLEQVEFFVNELSWLAPEILSQLSAEQFPISFEAMAQLRHGHKGVPVEVSISKSGVLKARFTGEWTTVSPGQAAVFYDLANERVLGGGRIAHPRQIGRALERECEERVL